MATLANSIVLIDDHHLVRLGLARAFESAVDFNIVGQAGTLAEARDVILSAQPRVVVTDVRLPDGSGLELIRRLRQQTPDIGLVVLTMYAGDEHLFSAMHAGASAFVSKEAPAEHVVAAARQALIAPRTFTAANLAQAMQRRMAGSHQPLSDREEEVLRLLSEGLGISAIASRLYISDSTAKTHIARIYDKLGAGNRAQAIMAAVRAGLLPS